MFNQNKKIIIYGGAVILILIIVIVVMTIINRLPVNVQITSTPTPIDVFINNQHFTTPTSVKLKPGTYTIWGSTTGYLNYTKDFKVSRQNNNLNITLQVDPDADYPPEGAPK